MKRVVILAISFITLVLCFTSCGEKKLNPNFLPHNQQIKLSTNIDNMVNAENKFGQTTKEENSELDEIVYKKDKITMAGIEWDSVAYQQGKFDTYPIIYYLKHDFIEKDFDKVFNYLNKTYGPYQANDFDNSNDSKVYKKSWVFTLDNNTEWRIILASVSEDATCSVAIIGNQDSHLWDF